MQVIAVTNGGVLISATNDEVSEILRSVNGKAPEKLSIGQKIPAIDYASSVTKLKELNGAYCFTNLVSASERFVAELGELKSSVKNASSIES